MSIKALPETAVRAIGASQTLADPIAVVKELVDNALDARATSIFVELSANAVDIIQVRDNGHGVPPEDRPLMAKRYCTSKIRNESDLASIGGSSLGFRGEALASAAEMSGNMSITTRVDGEDVGTTLIFAANGNGHLVRREEASHPVGTTVRIIDFLMPLSVRRQVALKSTNKFLTGVKKILQAYAFARPAVRLSLRILKSPKVVDNWTYPGRSSSSIADAATKIVGNSCASQCEIESFELEGYHLQAFLPRLGADSTKVSRCGQFISVDSRPISVARGIGKQILKVFKDALKKADSRSESIMEPFIQLNIVCPSRAYDANIEPSKDDLMFEDVDNLLSIIRQLFHTHFPEQQTQNPETARETLLQVPHPLVMADSSHGRRQADDPSSGQCQQLSNMSDLDYDVKEGMLLESEARHGFNENDMVEEVADITTSNPWVLAKVNSTRKTPAASRLINLQMPTPAEHDMSQVSSNPAITTSQRSETFSGMLTPTQSSPPRLDHRLQSALGGRLLGVTNLPAPLTLSTTVPPEPSSPFMMSDVSDTVQPASSGSAQRPAPPFQPPLAYGTPLDAIPEKPKGSRKQSQQRGLNKAFAMSVSKDRDAWFDLPEMRKSQNNTKKPKRSQDIFQGYVLQSQEQLGENCLPPRPPYPPNGNRSIRDFMTGRVASSPRRQDADPDLPDVVPASYSPHYDHQNPVLSSSFESCTFTSSEDTPDEGENAVQERPAKRQRPDPSHKSGKQSPLDSFVAANQSLHRTKSSQLPLERVAPKFQIQNLSVRLTGLTNDLEYASGILLQPESFLDWAQPAPRSLSVFDEAGCMTETIIDAWTGDLQMSLTRQHLGEVPRCDLKTLIHSALRRDRDDCIVVE